MIKFNILIIVTVMVNSINGNSNLCTLCKCDKPNIENKLLNLTEIKCDGQKNKNLNELIDLADLRWPESRSDTLYFVRLNNLNKYFLPKIVGSPDVIGLDLTNNLIRSVHEDAFTNFPNVEEITLRHNKLFGVEEWFKTNNKLKYLGLSNISISDLQPHCVSHLKHLRELDISYNSFTKLSPEFFEAINSVEYLHIHHNKIFFIESRNNKIVNSVTTSKLKYLDLSYNNLTLITNHQFENLISLETLILKENQIQNVDSNSFMTLQQIKSIDLSFNRLNEINEFTNCSSIQILRLNNNKIKKWQMHVIPEQLVEFYIQSNELRSFDGDNFAHLRIFNISYNVLSVMPNIKFESLEILDISYNELTAVPQGMAERTPVLDTLILDFNPISLIRFVDRIKLRRLSLNHMPLIKTIDYDTFKNIEETGTHSNGNITCMELEMSNCPYLSEIEPNAMGHVNFCKLDLSYNKIKSLQENLTDWSIIEKGINLQGNPFNCDCSVQWLVDIVVEQLYQQKKYQSLLRELRCNEPKMFANKRFVKFYKHRNIFCDAESSKSLAQLKYLDDDERVDAAGFNLKLDLSKGPNYITIIISCIVLLLVLIGFGLYWTKQQNKTLKNNRRFT